MQSQECLLMNFWQQGNDSYQIDYRNYWGILHDSGWPWELLIMHRVDKRPFQ